MGTTDQLLLNKTIMNNIIKNRRNAVCVWLDYKKAFDSIPHSWLLKSLELAKVPPEIIRAIRTLTETCPPPPPPHFCVMRFWGRFFT